MSAYPDQHTSHEGSDAHVLAQRTLSLSRTSANAVTAEKRRDKQQKNCTSVGASGSGHDDLDQIPHEYLKMSPQNKSLLYGLVVAIASSYDIIKVPYIQEPKFK